jgi:protein arginine N-methyltransferase 1
MIQRYRRMADDPIRVAAFQRAIAASVHPGDVVVDLGCAIGNFSVFACRAGAARVYAVEVEPILEVAREVVQTNGFAERVRFLSGRSTELDVPERAQVVLFEDYTMALLSPGVARTLADAVERWLAPGGQLVPERARLWVSPVEDRTGREEIDRFRWTGERASGVDLSPSRHRAFSSPYVRRLDGAALVASPTSVQEVDLRHVEDARVRASANVLAAREAPIHGLALWFELELAGEWLGTGPLSPPTAWLQTVFPLEEPLVVGAGQEIAFTLEGSPFGQEMVWRWRVAVGERECEAHSLEGTPLNPEQLVRWQPDQVARLTPELEVDRFILDAIDGQRTLAEIAGESAERFPRLLPRAEDAQRRVIAVMERRSR